jgi:hypothetical protein
MESLIYAANLTVTAATCLATYFYCQPEPMLTVVGWNMFFIALNLFQIARVLHARKTKKQSQSGAMVRSNVAAAA